MIDTSMIVDAALRKSQMLLDSLLSLDLSHEEAAHSDAAPPVSGQSDRARDNVKTERQRRREPPAYAREQLTVQVPMDTLQALTQVFEQIQAWNGSAEPADPSAQPALAHLDAGDSETSWSPRSSNSSLDSHGSPSLSMERPIARSRGRRKSEIITVAKSPSWASAVCAGLPLGVPPRHVPVQAAPPSPRASLQKTPAVVHGSSARCIAWHPVTVTKLHHTLAVC